LKSGEGNYEGEIHIVALGPIYAIFTAIDVCVRVWNGERDLKGKLPRRHQDTKKKLNGFV